MKTIQEKKRIRSLSLFLLLTVAIGNNVKAINQNRRRGTHPLSHSTELEQNFIECKNQIQSANAKLERYHKTAKSVQTNYRKLETELKQYRKYATTPEKMTQTHLNLEIRLEQARTECDEAIREREAAYNDQDRLQGICDNLQKEVTVMGHKLKKLRKIGNQCRPHACDIAITEITNYLFSCFDETGILENNNLFQLLHQSVKDSKKLQILSLAAASYGGRPHKLLDRDSAGTDSLSDDCKAGLANVVGKTANAVALRWVWNHLTASYFITRHRKKIGSNQIVKLACKLPKPIKKFCLNFGHLCAIRTLWNIEKTIFGKS